MKKSALFMRIALVITAILVVLWECAPTGDAATRLDALPAKGLRYASREMPLTAAEQDIYRGARVVKRLCRAGSQQFVLLAIDGSGNRHAVHDPLFCFRGAGWDVVNLETAPVRQGNAARVTLTRNGEHAEAVYWFTDGQSRHASALRYWLQTAARRLTFGQSGPEPVLVLLMSSGPAPAWSRVWDDFPELAAL